MKFLQNLRERQIQKIEADFAEQKRKMDARPWKILRINATIDGKPFIIEGQFMEENGNSVIRLTERMDLLLSGAGAFKFISI